MNDYAQADCAQQYVTEDRARAMKEAVYQQQAAAARTLGIAAAPKPLTALQAIAGDLKGVLERVSMEAENLAMICERVGAPYPCVNEASAKSLNTEMPSGLVPEINDLIGAINRRVADIRLHRERLEGVA